ncbi:hypothetical protein M9H77_24640 [Catharanthus roseus]|uniref:Uncharacterized protein n=1 Tax=Catharanthus roseus TaxID=4058 RepID=A0ACC0AXX9_CATRO|nr:hypothetical protein M9H77_24640 [Catharanthus roseus]
MEDNNFCISLTGAMDHLWFHRIILFSEPYYLQKPPLLLAAAASKPLSYSPAQSQLSLEEENPVLEVDETNAPTNFQDEQFDEEQIEKETSDETEIRERPTRLNLIPNKTRSHSSSPSTKKRSKNLGNAGGLAAMRLQKTMSCKSLCELELEEVKGFMDLGFRFNKDQLSKRMMSVIPGLQRLELLKTEEIVNDETEEEEEEGKGVIIRPYLSEAWLIKRPDSPLLNLRIPRVSTAADMKKHLKYWARTVASAIHQES